VAAHARHRFEDVGADVACHFLQLLDPQAAQVFRRVDLL
jgi:hypothetical protein